MYRKVLKKEKQYYMNNLVDILKIVFPALMVTGALGSLILNICIKGDWPVSLQWFGAMLLYTALLFRNKQDKRNR